MGEICWQHIDPIRNRLSHKTLRVTFIFGQIFKDLALNTGNKGAIGK